MKTPIVDFLEQVFNTDDTLTKPQFQGMVKGILYGLMIFQENAQEAFVELAQVVRSAKSEQEIQKLIDAWTLDIVEKQEWGENDVALPPESILWN